MSEIECDICGETFKTTQALAGHKRFKHAEGKTPDELKSTTITTRKGQSPLEVLVKDLQLPTLVDGQAEIFDSGVAYGIKSVLVGVRIAQELSMLGVQQATPVINMAKEMRESEGQAAKIIASELAEATLESNKSILEAIKAQGIASSPNPMMAGMWQMIQPYLFQTVGKFMGTFGVPAGQPQPQQQVQPQEQPMATGGGQQMTEDEEKEVFGE